VALDCKPVLGRGLRNGLRLALDFMRCAIPARTESGLAPACPILLNSCFGVC